jgi:hypothetical protein
MTVSHTSGVRAFWTICRKELISRCNVVEGSAADGRIDLVDEEVQVLYCMFRSDDGCYLLVRGKCSQYLPS